MALADDLLPVAYELRAIAGQEGFRPHSATLITTMESGTHTGDGGDNEIRTPLLEANEQNPRIRWLDDEEIAVGGYPGKGVVEIGAITPLFAGGGTDLEILTGADMQRRDRMYIEIVGPKHPKGQRYVVLDVQAERPLRYVIRARPSGGAGWGP